MGGASNMARMGGGGHHSLTGPGDLRINRPGSLWTNKARRCSDVGGYRPRHARHPAGNTRHPIVFLQEKTIAWHEGPKATSVRPPRTVDRPSDLIVRAQHLNLQYSSHTEKMMHISALKKRVLKRPNLSCCHLT